MSFKQAYAITFLAVALAVLSFMGGYWVRTRQAADHNPRILDQALEILTAEGLKATPTPPALEYGMIRGMLQVYNDPYTVFVEPPQHALESDELQGKFGGIGVRLGSDPQGNILLYPSPNSPASKSGVREGDRLLSAGSLAITPGLSIDAIQAALRGPVGQVVNIIIARPPEYRPQQVSIRRAEFPLPSVSWHLAPDEPRAGLIEVSLIAASTADEIQAAVKDLQGRGAAAFVLDLRDNPGGLLNAGVEIARLFLKDGVVIQQQYRDKPVETFSVDQAGPLADLPLVVLVNHGSASAAELIAGALQAHHRCLLAGAPSYGKDTIQSVYDLPDGSSLHVTSAHWWVPGLRAPIGGNGLQPDLLIDPADKNAVPDAALQAALTAVLKLK